MIKLTPILFIFFLTSCSVFQTEKAKKDKHYSDSTEREFQLIESGNGLSPIPEKKLPPIIPAHKEPQVRKIEQHGRDVDPRIIELNQNLSIYCMKSKRRERFKSDEACAEFVNHSLQACEKKHRLVNRTLINCVKQALQLR